MAKNLVIVESPAKAKTLKKFLGSNYKIEASIGHVRDLPKSNLGVDFENDYEPRYITIRGKGDILANLRKEVKNADKVYLATDPDREGEAISWHLKSALKLDDTKTYRITFNQITKNAVKNAIKEARDIDMKLVDAQQARRVLDRVVGYKISPLLWKKVKRRLSAGRVQSVALRIICDREELVQSFIPEEYWTIDAEAKCDGENFDIKLHSKQKEKIEIKTEEDANEIANEIQLQKFKIGEIKESSRIKKPSPPFKTSTLQQEASKVLGFATNKTMLVAQQLYEGVDIKGKGTIGLLTYIRTDSVRIADEAFEETKKYITDNFGTEYTLQEKQSYKSNGKAQDAHEAIRPTYVEYHPKDLKESLSKEQYKLYKLVWERFVGSQMANAVYDIVSVKIVAGDYNFRTGTSVLRFDGFLKVYNRKEENEEYTKLPTLVVGQELELVKVNKHQHFTQAPARFTDAMLVKTLEDLGIGRPSTYSAIITTLTQRNYVTKDNKIFYPTELGEIVNEILIKNFEDIVDVDFTAKMEGDLDKVEDGEVEWKEILRHFYPNFSKQIEEAEEKIGEISIEDEKTDIICEECGANMVIKYGKFGKFLACPSFPDCRNTKTLFEDAGVDCPLCEGKVLIKKTKKGRKYFGCENNPECEFISWNLPVGKLCPKCGTFLVKKGTKNPKIVCSNDKCNHIEEPEPEPEKD